MAIPKKILPRRILGGLDGALHPSKNICIMYYEPST